MVSLKDISADCGVSTATVSKALNNRPDISEATRIRVIESAQRLGYYPNLAAKSLKTNHTQNIGILFADSSHSGLTHDYFAAVLDSFKRSVERCGYDITFINSSRDCPHRMTYLERTRSRGFDGVMIACVQFDDPEVQELVRGDVPLVTIDYILPERTAVVSDNAKGMRDLTSYICRCGHRAIAYLHGEDNTVSRQRVSAFLDTAHQAGVEIPGEYMGICPYRDTAAAYAATKRLLLLPAPPTCIMYPDDYAAVGGMDAIREMGLCIPDDISIAGYDGTRRTGDREHLLTTICQDTEELGRLSAEQLIRLIEQSAEPAARVFTVAGRLFEGNTVRRISM